MEKRVRERRSVYYKQKIYRILIYIECVFVLLCVCVFVCSWFTVFLSICPPSVLMAPFSFCDISNFSRCISMRRRMLVNYHQITKHLFSNGKINNRTNELGDKMEKQFDRKTINKKATTTTTTSDKRPKKNYMYNKITFLITYRAYQPKHIK